MTCVGLTLVTLHYYRTRPRIIHARRLRAFWRVNNNNVSGGGHIWACAQFVQVTSSVWNQFASLQMRVNTISLFREKNPPDRGKYLGNDNAPCDAVKQITNSVLYILFFYFFLSFRTTTRFLRSNFKRTAESANNEFYRNLASPLFSR